MYTCNIFLVSKICSVQRFSYCRIYENRNVTALLFWLQALSALGQDQNVGWVNR